MAVALAKISGEGEMTHYFNAIKSFPILKPDEELALARRVWTTGDREASDRLVNSHLRLAAKHAMRYRFYGLPIADIITEANIGLLEAVKRFDPERGYKLATYALWWVRAKIQQYVLASWSLVKIGTTANQKKLFFGLRRAKSKIAAYEEGDLTPRHVSQLATSMGVLEKDIVDMNRRLAGDSSLNAPISVDMEGELQDWLVDDSPSQEMRLIESDESAFRMAALAKALKVLNPRERQVFEARKLSDDPPTLDDLGDLFGVSRERIRQIEVTAFRKVQAAMLVHIELARLPPEETVRREFLMKSRKVRSPRASRYDAPKGPTVRRPRGHPCGEEHPRFRPTEMVDNH